MNNFSPQDHSISTSSFEDLVLPVFHQNEYHLIRTHNIFRLEAAGGYTKIVLSNKSILVCSSLSHYEKRLGNNLFFRSHNSHLINLQKVVRFCKGSPRHLVMENQEVVPLSLSKVKELTALLGI